MYAGQIRQALAASIDTGKLAETWQALHPRNVAVKGEAGRESNPRTPSGVGVAVPVANALPTPTWLPTPHGDVTKAVSPLIGTFLDRALQAIIQALRRVLGRLWTEAWVLGQKSAESLSALQPVDWGAWTPGDYEAAEAIAGPGLRTLLDQAGVTIRSIADDRLEDLSAVLEQTLASDSILREPLPAPLEPSLSVGDLARQLRDVLDNPSRAELVAHTEIARAQSEAARQVYAETGRSEVEISTAEDDKVCPVCDAAEELGAHPIGSPPMVPLHPRCRCAELPVLAGAR